MKTLLKALIAVIILAMIGGYAYQQGWLQSGDGIIDRITGLRGSSTPRTIQVLNDTPPSDDVAAASCLVGASGGDCETPWGATVAHSEAIVSYQVGPDGRCETRVSVCNDGSYLADQSPYGLTSCPSNTSGSVVGCTLGDVTILAGQTITLYNTPTLEGDTWACDFSERTCIDGELDGNPEFTQFNCLSPASEFCQLKGEVAPEPESIVEEPSEDEDEDQEETPTPQPVVQSTTTTTVVAQPSTPREPNCVAPFGGGTWSPGQEGVAYPSSIVGYDETCSQVSIVCAYGSIRYGTASAPGTIVPAGTLSSTCTVSDPVGCTSSCGDVAHGATSVSYSQSIIPHGNGQTCSDIRIESTCTNGTLSPADGGACTCQIAPPAGCIAPDGRQVAHESSLTLYQYPQVIAVPGDGSDTCVRQWRQCINGGFYDRDGNRADFTYQYPECEIVEPDPGSGGGPGGEGIPTTQEVEE